MGTLTSLLLIFEKVCLQTWWPIRPKFFFWFLRLQLCIDLHPSQDGKVVHNKLSLQHLIATPIPQNIFLNPPSPGILWSKVGQPVTYCKRKFLNGF